MARPAKPTNLKIVTGNPGKRGLNKQEPDPDYLNDLTAPGYLSGDAQAVWDQIAPKLRESRLLTVVDVPILAMMCESIAEYRRATIYCKDSPLDHSEKTGGYVLSQWKIVQSMSLKQIMLIAREFGMTPASRTRIQIQPQGELDFGDGQNYFT
ncbi:phage terminase, small subunit, putative, P27 family [Nitrosomonas aestuarii]|uniref:Phage terminase, small subunit, putative, P27 family n=1 Tax=Nitrosomonas aestuarii TaxID=52441 RepID=A0A1I4C3X5_9PROT|nr:phage terminase small subunit P27 family [Nitrosomonas aestuarii]SFK74831.1 phage terminase, small subunit, putative, P27 family [Nitrosomonas aestuarii]